MDFINLTPNIVRLNDGREFPPSGTIARVSATHEKIGDGMYSVVFGKVLGIPEKKDGVMYIVSMLVASVVKDRDDVVSPAVGHKEAVKKDGQIYSVPGFVIVN